MRAEILQFQFEWLYLDPGDQTDLGNRTKLLGQNIVVGDRVGSVQNRFRVRLGPLEWDEFLGLLPNEKRLPQIAQFTRAYVGIGMDFDFQLVLKGSDVPCMQLGNESSAKLGWNTWIMNDALDRDVEDAVFDVAYINDGFSSVN